MDNTKPKLSIVPKSAMFEMAKAFTYGQVKHGKHNFKENNTPLTEILDAGLRHIYQFLDGEDYDEESQVLHLGNAMANLAMAIDMYYNRKNMDDRYKSKDWPENIEGS